MSIYVCAARGRGFELPLNFLVFDLSVPTVLPDALFIHLILTDQWLFNLFFLREMFGAQRIVAAAAAGGASERDRIEPRLLAMLAVAGRLDATMDNVAKAGLTTIPFINCMAGSQAKLCAFVDKAWHLGDSFADMAEAAKIIFAYVVSESTTLAEATTTVERAVRDLPPPSNPLDLALHVKTIGKQEFRLAKS